MEAGKLRHRLTLQTPTRAETSTGELQTTGHADAAGVIFASIEPLNARDVEQAKQLDLIVSHRIRCRYTRAITADCRLKKPAAAGAAERIFEIVGAVDVDERNRESVITAREVGPAEAPE